MTAARDPRRVPEPVLRQILEAGAMAPSGGNSQPWRFERHGDALTIWMLAERDHPVLNFRRRGTLLAHGMLIESIAIATRHHGYRPIIDLLPDPALPALSARVRFEDGLETGGGVESVLDAELHAAIGRRCTNRKPYRRDSLTPAQVKSLAKACGSHTSQGVDFAFISDRAAIERLARAASASDRIMFENRALHGLFFEELVWSAADARRRQAGLQVDTLELQPAQWIALRIFRYFPLLRLLNRFGAARSLSRHNALTYADCAMYLAVGCGTREVDLIRAGQAILRLWLMATAQGLSLQLQTGTCFLQQGAADGNRAELTPFHIGQIAAAYEDIRSTSALESTLIPALCRIGYSSEPGARSIKRNPEIRRSTTACEGPSTAFAGGSKET